MSFGYQASACCVEDGAPWFNVWPAWLWSSLPRRAMSPVSTNLSCHTYPALAILPLEHPSVSSSHNKGARLTSALQQCSTRIHPPYVPHSARSFAIDCLCIISIGNQHHAPLELLPLLILRSFRTKNRLTFSTVSQHPRVRARGKREGTRSLAYDRRRI